MSKRKLADTAPSRKREILKLIALDLKALDYETLSEVGDLLRIVLRGTSADRGVLDDAPTFTDYILNRLRNADAEFVMGRLNAAWANALRGEKAPDVLADPDVKFALGQLNRREFFRVVALAADVGCSDLGVPIESLAVSDHWASGCAATIVNLCASREKRLSEATS